MLQFEDAIREQVKLRAALVGANGSGKTKGAFEIATGIVGADGQIVVIDSQNGQAKLYADRYRFKHANLDDHTPEGYRDAARQAAQLAGENGVVIIDSGSHLWFQTLELVDRFGGWKEVTPRFNDAIGVITSLPCHVIVTIRAKVKYGVSEQDIPGSDRKRQVIERLGVGPQMRDGAEYEFDVLAYLDSDHIATFSNRCDPLIQGGPSEINDDVVGRIKQWLDEGDPPPAPKEFDPAVDMLPAAIRGNNASREILAALESRAPHIDWRATLPALGTAVYGEAPRELKGEKYVQWYRRLSNSVAKLDEFAPNDLPLPTDQQIVDAFAFGFPDWPLEITLVGSWREGGPAEDTAAAEAAAEAYDQEVAEREAAAAAAEQTS